MTVRTELIVAASVVAVMVVGFTINTRNREMALTIRPAQARESQPSANTVAVAGVTLHSVTVDLPTSDRMFPGGVDAEAINNNCLACHSASMVLNQPRLNRATWQRIVEKMRSQYKAPVADADVPAIVAYLASHNGAQ